MTSQPVTPAAVLWDMDGTLLDSEKLWDIAVAELSARHGYAMTPELRESTLGNSMTDALTKVFDASGVSPDARDYAADERWLLDRVAQLFADDLPWRPGAQEALTTIADAGIPMALVTNTVRELTDQALETIGAHFFAATVCGDEVENGKPAPDPYLRAASLLGVDASACVAVEDSPTGAQSATAAGCTTIVVPSTADVPQAGRRVFRGSLEGLALADLQTRA
ncbi:HAD family hydrolase [Gordonia aichiensis]|uniref:Putative hydrolase n=1 Tax=Gordonia aichiensis NBRC 108223 TaxID=1220583 RepID=L7KIX3_9ACTN|nr:HAD family phosphatase [Gordonia aichiensis]GAC48431.1 putative hydrolase [Gordonia aichiensis NBRC 108223]